MNYLLDTCLISELAKSEPNQKVVDWVLSENETHFYVSVLTFGEIHKGIEKLPRSKRKETLRVWIEDELKTRFQNRIIGIDMDVSLLWGKIQCLAEKKGKPMLAIDALIAATGIAHDLTVVTRNGTDIAQSGVKLLNPWG
ncbi:type II toxin-antitoxin system VapC family toxin [Desulfatitalea alkaliphila]|uniref:Type II toxin-antitoxin system VapC family toxin n=1 Tax=Desulfatitalea alkaliphila TaxID=2929485 RepID=A0AA41R3E3_9BACT|nr:type II toxin-antitoxin system VapC family toxin [Desulfatitalea alkaliphila]MCJ8502427.1 type II toxin-antitoxin system VapC family toxin [Desulfatitalea alkaliphila]